MACYRKCCRRHLLPCPPAQQTRARPPAVLCPLLPPPRSWNPPVVVRSRRCPGPEHATTSLRPDEACGRREGAAERRGANVYSLSGAPEHQQMQARSTPARRGRALYIVAVRVQGVIEKLRFRHGVGGPSSTPRVWPSQRLGSRRKGPVTCCSGQLLRQTARSKEASGRKEQPSLGAAVVVSARTCCLGGKPATPSKGGEFLKRSLHAR